MSRLDPSVCISCHIECKCRTFFRDICSDSCSIKVTRFCERCHDNLKTLHMDDDEIKVFINNLATGIEEQKNLIGVLSMKNIIYSQQIKYLMKNVSNLTEHISGLMGQNKVLTDRIRVLETVYNFRPNINAKPFNPCSR